MINKVLSDFLISDKEIMSRQDENFKTIITKGAELNLLLFSQESAWSADWESTAGSQGHKGYKLAAFPRLYILDGKKHLESEHLSDFLEL
jgi:hypothetical protein